MGRGGAALPVVAVSADGKDRLAEGTLLTLDSAVNAATGTIRLKASFPNESGALWPGAFVNALLQLDLLRDAVTVPAGAVQRGAAGTFVFVVKPDDTVEARAVVLGPLDEGLRVIREGLQPDDRVIVEGLQRARVGAKVSPKEAAKPAPAGNKT